jgi:hypothetical protein
MRDEIVSNIDEYARHNIDISHSKTARDDINKHLKGRVNWLRVPSLVSSLLIAIIYLNLSLHSMNSITSTSLALPFDISNRMFEIYKGSASFHIVSGYGLFRQMTGVGKWKSTFGLMKTSGEYPAVVQRPELIMEAYDRSNNIWTEIPFKYKPSLNTSNYPKFVAPHQPRLDWQMWFAALSNYQQQTWFINLVDRILNGNCDELVSLLDADKYPFPIGTSPAYVRAKINNYDFTRYYTEWSRRNPGATFVSNPVSGGWWYHTFHRDYIPDIEPNNTSVMNFLNALQIRRRVTCMSPKDMLQNCYRMNRKHDMRSVLGFVQRVLDEIVNAIMCNSMRIRHIPLLKKYINEIYLLPIGLSVLAIRIIQMTMYPAPDKYDRKITRVSI